MGVVNRDEALKNGYVGQVLRGCGIRRDVRRDNPYLIYDKLDFEIPTFEGCDVYARALVRRQEIRESIKILRQVITQMPKEGKIMQKLPKIESSKSPKGILWFRWSRQGGSTILYGRRWE